MSTKTIKVPQSLSRAATLTTEGEGDAKQVRISISSDTPYLRYDWWNDEEYYEVLDHSPGGFNDERLKAGMPVLYNHDRSFHLGRANDFDCDGHRIAVPAINVTRSESPDASLKWGDFDKGVLIDTSVGYSIIGDGICTGQKDGIPVYKFKWEPHEFSLVTIPADVTVGAGRNRDHKPEGEPREISVRDAKKIDTGSGTSQKSELQPVADEPNANHNMDRKRLKFLKPDNGETITVDAATERLEAITAERKRVADITALSEMFKSKGLAGRKIDTSAAAAKFIADGKSEREFRDHVMENTFEEVRAVVEIVSETGDRQHSRGNSIGAEFVRSKQFMHAASERGQGKRGCAVDFKEITMLGAKGKAQLAQRAGFTSADLASTNVQVLPGLVALGVQRLTIMDMLAGGVTGAAALPYPKENGFGKINGVDVVAGQYPRAQAVGEGGLKPNWDPDLTTDVANVKKIAVTTKVPDEFMSDFPSMQSYIDERMPYMVDLETEFQLLYGDGLGNNLKGIFSTAGVQSRPIDATSDMTVAASLKKGLTDVGVGSQFEPTAYGFHPYDWETASLLKDGAGRFLAGGPFYIPYGNGVFMEMNTFWGKPVVISTSITYGRPITGSFKLGAQYFVREGMRLETTNSNEDDFRRNLIAVRAEHRLALATYRPVAFLEFTGFPARA